MEFKKVRELSEPSYQKVKDIQPGKSGYNIYLKVVSKNILIDIKRLDGSRVVIADFIVGDETGVIKMRLRHDNYIDLIEENKIIIARNCKIPVINGHMRIIVDAFGKIETSNNVKIDNVKTDNNLTLNTIDNYSIKSKQTLNNSKLKYNDNLSYQSKGTNFA